MTSHLQRLSIAVILVLGQFSIALAALDPCPAALIPIAVTDRQRSYPPERAVDAFVGALGIDYSYERLLPGFRGAYITPVAAESLRHLNQPAPDLGFLLRIDYEGRRVPLMLIAGFSSEPPKARSGTVINLIHGFPSGHPFHVLLASVIRPGGIAALGLPLSSLREPSDGRIQMRFDSNWCLAWETARGKQCPVTGDIFVMPSVFAPGSVYSRNLLQQVIPRVKPTDRVLVLGTGSGIDVLRLLTDGGVQRPIDAVDINPIAVANTKLNADYWGLGPMVNAGVSDGFAQVRGQYDMIVFDAPLATPLLTDVPGLFEEVNTRINLHDFEGRLLSRLLADLPTHLAPGGRFYLMSGDDISGFIATGPQELQDNVISTFQEAMPGRSFQFGIHEISVRQ